MIDLQTSLYDEQPTLHDILDREPPMNENHIHHTVVWTDGACRNNQDDRLRRAGCGVFFTEGDARNISMILPGIEQSNNRAELLSAILAMHACPNKLEIRTDSTFVIDGFAKLSKNISWMPCDNQDLWKAAATLLRTRKTEVTLTKVKGHAKQIDVDRGHVMEIDKIGNDGADALACAGADMHLVPPAIIDDAGWRVKQAMTTQRMMIAIVKARFEDHG